MSKIKQRKIPMGLDAAGRFLIITELMSDEEPIYNEFGEIVGYNKKEPLITKEEAMKLLNGEDLE
jgi:hypothetical protein